ncbi:hypothetical protein [Actinoplanes cyaneus]|uniref:hypothetical protein n=1 Tax=Actinoplanes cyaneus TaxID=52696 RepID=UPI001942F40F|nr:hypothetical protein [Actinoplanes cyaneus]
MIRTPLRLAHAAAWVDPRSGTVRFGARDRTRTLLAGLAPDSYLVSCGHTTVVATTGSAEALTFTLEDGASAAIGTTVKPAWCSAVEATLPEPLADVPHWLEVGIRVGPARSWYCGIPLGRLPAFQTRIAGQGHRLTYITRIRVADHATV